MPLLDVLRLLQPSKGLENHTRLENVPEWQYESEDVEELRYGPEDLARDPRLLLVWAAILCLLACCTGALFTW
jgi:hypothetical protein